MDYLNIIVPICSAIGTIVTLRNLSSKRFEKIEEKFEKIEKKIDERFDKVNERFNRIEEKFEKINDKLNETNSRVVRIEGYLFGLDRPKNGTEK